MGFDIHILVREDEYDGWVDIEREDIKILDRNRDGTYLFYRILTTEETYIYLKLKYGTKNVWLR